MTGGSPGSTSRQSGGTAFRRDMATTRMKEADVEEVSELLRSSYAMLAEREGLSRDQADYLVTERGSVECVRRESKCQRYMVAREGGGITGIVAVSGDTIAKLYVHPDCTGQGVGRSLYDAAESVIRGEGHGCVRLGAFPTAVPFYEKMGLVAVGRKAATGPLEGRAVVLMEKKLKL